jgi:hypothetical protein
MPKVVESKLIFKGEDQLSPKLEHIIDVLEKLGSTVEKVSEKLARMGEGFGGGGGKTFAMAGKDGAGKASRGSGRSENAPTPKDTAPPKDKGLYPGWHSGMRFAGGMMGAAGGVIGGLTHQVTPAVGGMLSAAGGAISSVSVAGVPIGAIPGLAMMTGGAIMTGASIAAQPALSHYEQFADTYRMLGEDKSKKLRSSNMFRPDEAMKFGGMLNKVGAFEGFGTMEKMRMGKIAPDEIARFFGSATQAGAAGKMKKEDYDYLGKAVVFGLGKDKNQISQTQSLETLEGLMAVSAEHLGDLDKNQIKELTALTVGMEGQRSSAQMRGPAGVKTMAGMMGVVGGEGSNAEEMFKWQAFKKKNPGGSYTDYLTWKSGPGATMDVLGELEGMGEMGGIIGSRMFGKNYPAMMGILKAAKETNEPAAETVRRLEEAQKGALPTQGEPGGNFVTMANTFTTTMAEQKKMQLEFSENIMKPYLEMETKLIKGLTELLGGDGVFKKAVEKFSEGIAWLVKRLDSGDDAKKRAETAFGINPDKHYGMFGTEINTKTSEQIGLGPTPRKR